MDGMRPDLPDCGAYLRWPEEGVEWIREADRILAQELLPSRRVWKRTDWDGEFYRLEYGATVIYVRPSLWTRVPMEKAEIGNQVEVLSRHGLHEPKIGTIVGKWYLPDRGAIQYQVLHRDHVDPFEYSLDDFQVLSAHPQLREPTTQHPIPKCVDEGTDRLPWDSDS